MLIGGVKASLYFTSPTQINAQIPYGISGAINLTVRTAAGTSTAVPLNIVANAPKFFTSSQGGTGFIVVEKFHCAAQKRPLLI